MLNEVQAKSREEEVLLLAWANASNIADRDWDRICDPVLLHLRWILANDPPVWLSKTKPRTEPRPRIIVVRSSLFPNTALCLSGNRSIRRSVNRRKNSHADPLYVIRQKCTTLIAFINFERGKLFALHSVRTILEGTVTTCHAASSVAPQRESDSN